MGGARNGGERSGERHRREAERKKDRPKETIREAREKKTNTVSERNGNVFVSVVSYLMITRSTPTHLINELV